MKLHPTPATTVAEGHPGRGLPPLPCRARTTAAPPRRPPLSPEARTKLERIADRLARLAETEDQQ